MAEQATISGPDGTKLHAADNRALIRPQSDWDYALSQGNAYSWSNLTWDYAQHNTILAVENNSATMDLRIHKIYLACDTAGEFTVFSASGKTLAGTALVGVNLNRNSNATTGSINVAPATAKANETGQTEQGDGYPGRLITGKLPVNIGLWLDIDGAIILPNDHMIGIDSNINGTGFTATIWGYFK